MIYESHRRNLMSIKDDDGFMEVFSRNMVSIVDMSIDLYTSRILREDYEKKQTSLMTELIEYIDKYVEEKLEDQLDTIRINEMNNYLAG